jgi:hypothetical protein
MCCIFENSSVYTSTYCKGSTFIVFYRKDWSAVLNAVETSIRMRQAIGCWLLTHETMSGKMSITPASVRG